MADELSVDPDELSASGEQLSKVGKQLNQVLTSLQTELAGYGQPWGNDETGHQFADGSKGYVAQRDLVFKAIGDTAKYVGSSADSLSDAADSFDQQDND
jgi:uncharacterized protein YukE